MLIPFDLSEMSIRKLRTSARGWDDSFLSMLKNTKQASIRVFLTLRNTGTHRRVVFRPFIVFGLARLKFEMLNKI